MDVGVSSNIHFIFFAAFISSDLASAQQEFLIKHYGVSRKMIDATLRTIILNQWDAGKIRKRTEIRRAFEAAIDYFQAFAFDDAVQLLI